MPKYLLYAEDGDNLESGYGKPDAETFGLRVDELTRHRALMTCAEGRPDPVMSLGGQFRIGKLKKPPDRRRSGRTLSQTCGGAPRCAYRLVSR
jgi:hypothetical protein